MIDSDVYDARMRVAQAVRRARIEEGLSLALMAKVLKCTYPMISQFESDGLTPRSKFFWRYVLYFKLDPDSFGFDPDFVEEGHLRFSKRGEDSNAFSTQRKVINSLIEKYSTGGSRYGKTTLRNDR